MEIEFGILKREELMESVELATRAYMTYEYFTNFFPDPEERRKALLSMQYRAGLTNFGKTHFLKADIPLRKIFGYATGVRSISKGTALYSMKLLGYRPASN